MIWYIMVSRCFTWISHMPPMFINVTYVTHVTTLFPACISPKLSPLGAHGQSNPVPPPVGMIGDPLKPNPWNPWDTTYSKPSSIAHIWNMFYSLFYRVCFVYFVYNVYMIIHVYCFHENLPHGPVYDFCFFDLSISWEFPLPAECLKKSNGTATFENAYQNPPIPHGRPMVQACPTASTMGCTCMHGHQAFQPHHFGGRVWEVFFYWIYKKNKNI